MTTFRTRYASILSGRTLKMLKDAGLTVVESDELAKCHAEIARLKRIVDHAQEYAEGLRAELQSWEDAV